MSTKAEKVKAQSLAAVGVHFNDYRRHLVGPNELETALASREILNEMVPVLDEMAKDFGSKWETDMPGCADLIRRAKEVV